MRNTASSLVRSVYYPESDGSYCSYSKGSELHMKYADDPVLLSDDRCGNASDQIDGSCQVKYETATELFCVPADCRVAI